MKVTIDRAAAQWNGSLSFSLSLSVWVVSEITPRFVFAFTTINWQRSETFGLWHYFCGNSNFSTLNHFLCECVWWRLSFPLAFYSYVPHVLRSHRQMRKPQTTDITVSLRLWIKCWRHSTQPHLICEIWVRICLDGPSRWQPLRDSANFVQQQNI